MADAPGTGKSDEQPPRGEILGCKCAAADAPGWAAIDERLKAVYGAAPEKFFESTASKAEGGDDPLEGIAVYRADDPYPHWHLVALGLTELFDKMWNKPEVSGWGFELTFRVACDPDDESPPPWALALMQSLARYVDVTGRPFAPAQHMDAFGPLDPETDTALTAVCFAEDPVLGTFETPNGLVRFLQIVGISADERALVLEWDAASFMDVLTEHDPMLVTDLGRPSLLDDPATAEQLRARADAEGSSVARAFVDALRWEPSDGGIDLVIGALHVAALERGLARRVAVGKGYELLTSDEEGRERVLVLSPGSAERIAASEERLELTLTPPQARDLAREIGGLRGRYEAASVPAIAIVVEPTEIRDDDDEVVEVIG